jgi:phenylacetic acid degradation operon negative regulatory protein
VSASSTRRHADTRIQRWIRRELRRDPPRAKSLVVTVWGDAIAPHGGVVWLSGLIRLLAPLGLNERLVRTSVYRLAREGWLTARQDGRRSLYRLTAQGLARFEHAYKRIYAPPAEVWDGTWNIVLAPAAALKDHERRNLRKELGWEGFSAILPGVFVRPESEPVSGTLAEILGAHHLEDRVAALIGRDLPALGVRSLQAQVRACWNLAAVAGEYRKFLSRFGAVSRGFGDGSNVDAEQCFVVRSLLIHAFRRVTLHDPQLPAELLPPGWPAAEAYAVCRDFYRLTHRRAEQHLLATLATHGDPPPPAAPYFYRRFGGLKSR